MKQLAAGKEHTAAILLLKEHAAATASWMAHAGMPFFLHPINETWSALYIQDEKLEQASTVTMLIELSKFISLLAFRHAEDWGWGYRVFVNGFEVAYFYDDYHFDHTLAVELARERHPDKEDILYFLYFDQEGRALFDSLVEEINSSRHYLEQQFARKNVQSFAAFNVGAETLAALDELISIGHLRDQRLHWRQVEAFKDLLGFPEMTRRNFNYLLNIFGKEALMGTGR